MSGATAPLEIGVIGARGIGDLQGGIERYCSNMYARLSGDDFKVTIFVRRAGGAAALPPHVRTVHLAAPRLRSLETVIHSLCAVIVARWMGIGVLHMHGIGACLAAPLATLLGMRVILRHVGADYDRAKWGAAGRLALKLGERAAARYAETVVCLNADIAARFARATGRTNCVVIPNGVTPPATDLPPALLSRLGLEPGRFVLGVGRMVPEKNFHLLVEAFLAARLPHDAKLVLAGDIDYPGAYSRHLSALIAGQEDRIVRAGTVFGAELWALYRHARCFVLPSAHEGMSFSLLEAGISGTRIIASAIPANREVCAHFGRLVTPGSAQALCAALEEEWRDEPDPAEIAAQIAECRARFDWSSVAAAMAPILAPPPVAATRRFGLIERSWQ